MNPIVSTRISRFLKTFIYSGLLLVTSVWAITSCGAAPEPASNVKDSEEDAQRALDARLKKTDEVRIHLKALREAIRPIETLLSDLEHALNAKVTINGKPIDKVQTHLDAMQSVIKEAADGIADIHPDGSWTMNRKLSVPLLSEKFKCDSSEVQVSGRRVNEREQLIVKIRDCTPEATQHVVVDAQVHSGGLADVVFYPENLTRLFWSEVKSEQCSGSAKNGDTEIHCKPIVIKGKTYDTIIDPLDFVSNSGGIDAHIKVNFSEKDGRLIAEGELEAHPGIPTRISIRTQ